MKSKNIVFLLISAFASLQLQAPRRQDDRKQRQNVNTNLPNLLEQWKKTTQEQLRTKVK